MGHARITQWFTQQNTNTGKKTPPHRLGAAGRHLRHLGSRQAYVLRREDLTRICRTLSPSLSGPVVVMLHANHALACKIQRRNSVYFNAELSCFMHELTKEICLLLSAHAKTQVEW